MNNKKSNLCYAAKYAPSGSLICNCPNCIKGSCPFAAPYDEVCNDED